VDYPKTGIKAQMQKRHRVRQWPHFFDKPIEEGQYRSEKILGQLYDLVERIDFKPCYDSQPDEQLITAFELTENELQEAKEVKVEYDAAMKRIMAQHDIKTEFEVWSTFVMSHSNANDYKFHEVIGEISSSLKEQFRKIVTNSCNDRRSQLPRKVAAMYATTAREIEDAKRKQQADRMRMTPRNRNDPPSEQLSKEDIEGLPFMSFPWIFPEILVDISHGRLVAPRDYVPVHDDVSLVLETDFEEVSIESLTGDSDIAVSDGDGHGNSEDGSDVEVVEAI
jgi:RNA-dependent RNA polymerase